MSIFGQWKTVTIANGGTTSAECDLGRPYENIQIIIPTITVGTLNITVSEATGGTFVRLGATDMVASGTGNYADTFELGGYQFIKLVAATQVAARTFRVRGYRS